RRPALLVADPVHHHDRRRGRWVPGPVGCPEFIPHQTRRSAITTHGRVTPGDPGHAWNHPVGPASRGIIREASPMPRPGRRRSRAGPTRRVGSPRPAPQGDGTVSVPRSDGGTGPPGREGDPAAEVHRRTGRLAAATSSGRLTGVVTGA